MTFEIGFGPPACSFEGPLQRMGQRAFLSSEMGIPRVSKKAGRNMRHCKYWNPANRMIQQSVGLHGYGNYSTKNSAGESDRVDLWMISTEGKSGETRSSFC